MLAGRTERRKESTLGLASARVGEQPAVSSPSSVGVLEPAYGFSVIIL